MWGPTFVKAGWCSELDWVRCGFMKWARRSYPGASICGDSRAEQGSETGGAKSLDWTSGGGTGPPALPMAWLCAFFRSLLVEVFLCCLGTSPDTHSHMSVLFTSYETSNEMLKTRSYHCHILHCQRSHCHLKMKNRSLPSSFLLQQHKHTPVSTMEMHTNCIHTKMTAGYTFTSSFKSVYFSPLFVLLI